LKVGETTLTRQQLAALSDRFEQQS
jgi:hypothetical protein